MKVLYYDCFSGISGDMNLGALVDLGVDPEKLISELKKLPVTGYTIKFSKAYKKGIHGTRAEVILEAENDSQEDRLKNRFHTIRPVHENQESKPSILQHQQGERDFKTIRSIIENSSLSQVVKQYSINMFQRLAEAEGKIHGKPPDEVHFHEVGAVDSIVDIVGAAICIDLLKPDKIMASPLQLGGGFVNCAHGIFPVPAPATAEILKGIPVRLGAVQAETTTPTGAVILASLCGEFTEKPDIVFSKIAYGIGYKDFDIPNVLRVIWAEEATNPEPWLTESSLLIECNIDDMSSERYDYVMEKLFSIGADDVFIEPISMKKNRPAQKLSVLMSPAIQNEALEIIFRETTTLGVRIMPCQKKMMHRHSETLLTEWGPVTIKYGLLHGNKIKAKPEYNDCSKIARENNLSFNIVYNTIMKLISLE